MQLPIKIPFELMLTKWASILNPLIANPTNNLSILDSFTLAAGNNQIPHKLDRIPKGWIQLDINAAATIYRYQASTINFLYLNSSAPATVTLGVF